MTKKKNKAFIRRRVRQATKNVNVDVGFKGSRKFIVFGYKMGAGPGAFSKVI